MTRSGNLVLALIVSMAVAAALAPVRTSAVVTCPSVTKSMTPCMTYLITAGATPSTECCNGVNSLVTAASTTADRRKACSCLKSAAQSITKIIPNNAATLPAKCSANIKYKISRDTDCNKIN